MATSPINQRILVTGSAGNLGQDLMARLNLFHNWDVVGTARTDLDLTWSADHLQRVLDTIEPDVILNTAGFTAVDLAETDRDTAQAANQHGPAALAAWAEESGAYLIHLSTDYVFAGDKGSSYTVSDTPHPINYYGETKLAGERAVRDAAPEHSAVVRTSWLFGPGEKNFVPFILSAARDKRAIRVASDQVGTPTWTGNLCKMLIDLLQDRPTGIFHGCGAGTTTRYDQALYLCQCLGVEPDFMTAIPTADFGFAAQRPTNSSMVSSFSDAMDWREATDRFLAVQREHVSV